MPETKKLLIDEKANKKGRICDNVAKDCLLTDQQACSRITRLFVCHQAKKGLIHRKMVVECPHPKVKPSYRPDLTMKEK